MDVTQARRLLRLVLLAPSVVEVLMRNNRQMPINLEFVLRKTIPADWQEQRALFS